MSNYSPHINHFLLFDEICCQIGNFDRSIAPDLLLNAIYITHISLEN